MSIEFTFTRTVTLRDLWYDARWHQEMLNDGLDDEAALKTMLRAGWAEDWLSIVQEMVADPHKAGADVFADSCSHISVKEAASA